MLRLLDPTAGKTSFFMGNEAIARGALEAGVRVAAGYPGTPSSEIIENLALVSPERNLYVEWSVNEKVALEVAAAASFAGLRSLVAMKQNGLHVASDFLLHLGLSGIGAGMLLVVCDDPGAQSSVNEGEIRYFARLLEIPLIEPGDFQEAKDLVSWAFDLSEELKTIVILRSSTRLSHASGNVRLGSLQEKTRPAGFPGNGNFPGSSPPPLVTMPVLSKHRQQQEKLGRIQERFEACPANFYQGPPRPDLLVITSGICFLYSREAVARLGLGERVGILKLATTWPLPEILIRNHLRTTSQVLFIEEILPFLEEGVKVIAADAASDGAAKTFFGKKGGTIPATGELDVDVTTTALGRILGISPSPAEAEYRQEAARALALAPPREPTFCAGCPHRAAFFSIHRFLRKDGRDGFVCGDIGCYSLASLNCGYHTLKTLHSMGSGLGLASGFGQLWRFGLTQPVLAVCGDSTFYHAALPALVNAVHHGSRIGLIILDNAGTAMTGFQPHPGLDQNAMKQEAHPVSIAEICRAVGAEVNLADPFDLEATEKALAYLFDHLEDRLQVLILRQPCALSPERKARQPAGQVRIDQNLCLDEQCGCHRFCTRILRCPGTKLDPKTDKAVVDEFICTACGFCIRLCPAGAISEIRGEGP